jgi:hypothetical protein
MFKSSEEKEAARKERAAAEAREEAERAEKARAAEEQRKRAAFLATPVGAATAAKEAGHRFLEIQLKVGGHEGSAGFGSTTSSHSTKSSAATLEEIEKLGWHLEHASYFFMITRESSTEHFITSGESTAITGTTMGVYLFRNANVGDARE